MRMHLGELRKLVREAKYSRHVFFVKKIWPILKRDGLLPVGTGQVIDAGNSAVVCTFASDKIIRVEPAYDYEDYEWDFLDQEIDPNDVYADFVVRMTSFPKNDVRFVHVFDTGQIVGRDRRSGKPVMYAMYAVMEKLTPLSPLENEVVVKTLSRKSIDDRSNTLSKLVEFLKWYMNTSLDVSEFNVMKRGDDYVVIDPEEYTQT